MPAPRAYSEAEVIARGLALEARGAVTPASLHRSLGGRGDPNTAFAAWTAFIGHRGRPGQAAPAEAEPLSPAVSGLISEILVRIADLAGTASGERDAVHDRRARQNLAANDALLARAEALEAEADALRGEIRRLSAALACRPAGAAPGRLILP